MAHFLAKTDPDTYSIDDFAREKRTTWDGVTNAAAVQAIGKMSKGDIVFLYLSGGISAIGGWAKVESAPRLDPNNSKSKVVDLKFMGHLEPFTTLKEVKESGLFADFALVRQGRLSTMQCPESFVEWLRPRYPKAKF